MADTLYLSLIFLTATVGMAVSFFSWLNRDRPGAKPLTVFGSVASFWAVTEALIVASAGVGPMLFYQQIALTLSAVAPLTLLVTVLAYTGNHSFLTRRRLALLLVEPAAFVTLVWSNDSHALVLSAPENVPFGELSALLVQFELAFWGHQVYSYLLVTAGAFLLVRQLFRQDNQHRLQATALLIAVAISMLGNAAHIFGFFPVGLDPTGVGFVLTTIVFGVILFRTRLLGIAPVTRDIGREAVLAELDDAIIILDDGGRIVDVNEAGEAFLGGSSVDYAGRSLAKFSPSLANVVTESDDRAELELERRGKVRYYDVRLSEIYRGYGTFSGTAVSLRDVTERRQRQQRLDVLNRLLRHNVRNELNLVRGKIELAQTTIDDETATDRLDEATDAVDGIVARSDKVGRLSRLLEADDRDSVDIATELRGEEQSGGLGPASGEVVLDLPETLHVAGGSSLVAAFAELVTNAVEHTDEAQPQVTVTVDEGRSDDDHVVIAVSDEGPGIDAQEWQTILEGRETPLQHSSGVGLWLVNWVVTRAGGTLEFETNGGTTVRVRLPRVSSAA